MVYSPVCYAVFCLLRLSSTCAWELVNNSVSIASIAFVISSLTSQLSCRLKSPKTEEVAPESSFFPLQIISLFKLTCSMLPEARTTQYNRHKYKPPIIVQMKGYVFVFHFQNVSSSGYDFVGFRRNSSRLNQILRIFAMTSESPFHLQ